MMKFNRIAVLGALVAFAATGCADLDVENPNDPDAERAVTSGADIESLIASSFREWWISNGEYEGASFHLSTASFQHSAWPANAGAVFYSQLPRVPIVNNQVDQYYGNIAYTWDQSYKALAAVADGLRAFEEDPSLVDDLANGADDLLRLRAYSRFVQGLAHASVALFYDQGFRIDETVETLDGTNPVVHEPMGYNELMDVAFGYFDEAIALADGAEFTIPEAWTSVPITAEELIPIIHSYKARFRAAVARTPAERAAVDWQQVVADIDAGVQDDWSLSLTPADESGFFSDVVYYFSFAGWQQLTYMMLGMADQSGNYQDWLDLTIPFRVPDIDPDGDGTASPVLIITPDTRFAQGETLDEHIENPGTLFSVPPFNINNNFQQPGRGTWRWSYYWTSEIYDQTAPIDYATALWPEITLDEMNLLKAEALYRIAGNAPTAEAVALVNETRMAAGLDDIGDGNDACVPRLPDGSCGGFFEALKWEKRLETQYKGLHGVPWYFEGRGWGDLYKGTPLQFPMPCEQQYVLNLTPCETYGGQAGGDYTAATSTYAFPYEG